VHRGRNHVERNPTSNENTVMKTRSELPLRPQPQGKTWAKIKREAKAKGLYLPGWVGFVTGHPEGILVFRAWMHQQTGVQAGATYAFTFITR
jgi:hypothetical protein